MSAKTESIGTVCLTLKGVPNWTANEATETQRLRAALKCLLRGFGLRATDVRSVLPPPDAGLDAERDEPPFHPPIPDVSSVDPATIETPA